MNRPSTASLSAIGGTSPVVGQHRKRHGIYRLGIVTKFNIEQCAVRPRNGERIADVIGGNCDGIHKFGICRNRVKQEQIGATKHARLLWLIRAVDFAKGRNADEHGERLPVAVSPVCVNRPET